MERFWSKVDRREPDECWPWTASRFRSGYGAFQMGANGMPNTQRAHRVAWVITNGPIPEGMQVLHTCDNPACCNPAHLWLGDHAANMADRKRKGRYRHGPDGRFLPVEIPEARPSPR